MSIQMFLILPTGSNLLQGTNSTMEDILIPLIHPAVLQMILFPARHVVESIIIIIMVLYDVLVMKQELRSPFIR